MQDLINKIEELKKALGAMKPKEKNNLVPALSLPAIKPLSISASSGSATKSKLPGVAPASGKDPKKMAEQLKNPRPKKPKVEMLKFDKNGQWSLEKVNSNKSKVEAWTTGGDDASTNYSTGFRTAREKIPRLEGPARIKGLTKLSQLTQSRLNPQTKEKEYLLHRGTDWNEVAAHKVGKVNTRSSWTPDIEVARSFAPDESEGLMSSWIPEKHIHHMPWAIDAAGSSRKDGGRDFTNEREVIVNPHKLQFHVPEKVKKFGEGNSV